MPRIGFTYDLTDQLSVYSNISKSFKPNSGADRNNQGFKPEEGILRDRFKIFDLRQ
jgi:iron complex outermembrane receptor protein